MIKSVHDLTAAELNAIRPPQRTKPSDRFRVTLSRVDKGAPVDVVFTYAQLLPALSIIIYGINSDPLFPAHAVEVLANTNVMRKTLREEYARWTLTIERID